MAHPNQPQVAYPTPGAKFMAPPPQAAVYAPPPPPGYPVAGQQQIPNPVPVVTKARGDGFWKGCCAALCCCCVVEECCL